MENKSTTTEKQATREYETPRIEDHGDLAEMTAGTGGHNLDSKNPAGLS